MRLRRALHRTGGPLRPHWHTIVCLALTLLFVGVALSQLQALLSAMHLSGKTPYSIGGLNHLFHKGPDAANTQSAIDTWRGYAAETAKHAPAAHAPETASPENVVRWSFAVDSLAFVPLYVALLWTFLTRMRHELEAWKTRQVPAGSRLRHRIEEGGLDSNEIAGSLDDYTNVARWTILAAILAGIVDEVENITSLLLVELNWADTHYGSVAFRVLIWILWVAGCAKWILGLGAFSASVVLGWVLLAGHADSAGNWWRLLRRRLWALRLHVTLALLVGVIFFAHEQMPDLVLRWTPIQLGLDLALAGVLAVTLWLFGHQLLTRGPIVPNWSSPTETILAGGLVGIAALLAGLQLTLHFTVDGRFRAGWGLIVPAVIIVAIAVLSRLIPPGVERLSRGSDVTEDGPPGVESVGAPAQPAAASAEPAEPVPVTPEETARSTPSAAEENPILPRVLAAAVVVGVATGILHASFGSAVYQSALTWWAPGLIAAALGGLLARLIVGRGEWLVWAGVPVVGVLVALGLTNDGELNIATLVSVSGLLFVAGLRVFYVFKLSGPGQRPRLAFVLVVPRSRRRGLLRPRRRIPVVDPARSSAPLASSSSSSSSPRRQAAC